VQKKAYGIYGIDFNSNLNYIEQMRKDWTKEELKILHTRIEIPLVEMCKLLPGRTGNAVKYPRP